MFDAHSELLVRESFRQIAMAIARAIEGRPLFSKTTPALVVWQVVGRRGLLSQTRFVSHSELLVWLLDLQA